MARAVRLPSAPFCGNSTTLAPGLSRLRSPGSRLTMGTSSGTTTVFSPSPYFTVMRRPWLTTRLPTVPLVMVEALPSAFSQGRWPSPLPRRLGAKTCTSRAFRVPSGCGTAAVPMKLSGWMSSGFASDTARIAVLSVSLTVSCWPLRAFSCRWSSAACWMVPRSGCSMPAGGCAAKLAALARSRPKSSAGEALSRSIGRSSVGLSLDGRPAGGTRR